MRINDFVRNQPAECFDLQGQLCWSFDEDVIGIIYDVCDDYFTIVLSIFWSDGDRTISTPAKHLECKLIEPYEAKS